MQPDGSDEVLYTWNLFERHTLKIIPFLAAIGLLGLIASAQDAKPEQSLAANPVYQKNCADCDQKTAKGRFMAGPSLASEKATAMSRDELPTVMTQGKQRMPKFEGKLQPSEIDVLVQQMQSQGNQK